MPNRPARHQGVVYGPPRPPQGERAGSALLGRMVGLAMIGLALAVLVGAAVLLNRPPGPTPTRAIGPSPSPSPAPTTPGPSGLPSASPTASPSPSATPTPFVPVVQVGPGFVTFGTRLTNDRTVADPRASFAPSDRIAWSAYLTAPANAENVTAYLFKLDDTTEDGERLLSEGGARPNVKNSDHFTRSGIRPERDLDGPGIYLVRYVKGDIVVAEGYFVLTG